MCDRRPPLSRMNQKKEIREAKQNKTKKLYMIESEWNKSDSIVHNSIL